MDALLPLTSVSNLSSELDVASLSLAMALSMRSMLALLSPYCALSVIR
ncbi:Uncharacterised protein [Enterobacter hormaechei]|nr:Uncharacterised protein [Enterobacter hormaechei]SAA62337.1 Uncharacterised protein [Enterobacter hormaechei]VAG87869.1 Uncharacterised protein [Enterobacter hormaechei]